MTQQKSIFEGKLRRSRNLDYFRNADDFFVYHNIFGYIIQMSEDLVEFIEFFAEERDGVECTERFGEQFGEELLQNFLSVLRPLACIVPDDDFEKNKAADMYAVHARWITAHRIADDQCILYVNDNIEHRGVKKIVLNGIDAQIWDLCDGTRKCSEIAEMTQLTTEALLDKLFRWSHCSAQLLKLSADVCKDYRNKRFGVPPYLISTMPYLRVTDSVVADKSTLRAPDGDDAEYFATDEKTAVEDRICNRLGSLLAEKNPVLHGKSYGEALYGIAKKCTQMGKEKYAVLDIGGGGGETAASLIRCYRHDFPMDFEGFSYTVLAADESYAERQRESCAGLPVEIIVGDVEEIDTIFEGRRFDLIVCDEFLANLESASVRKMTAEDPDDVEDDSDDVVREDINEALKNITPEKQPIFLGEGDSVTKILSYKLNLVDAPEDFYLNTGSIRLLEKAIKLCDGQIFFIEFGHDVRYPQRSFEDDAITYSQHFGILGQVAKKLGCHFQLDYLYEVFPFDRELSVFATTRSQFKALRRLFSEYGIPLERKAYTEKDFKNMLASLPGSVEEINFEKAEERISGLVPHSYRMMRIFKEIEFF